MCFKTLLDCCFRGATPKNDSFPEVDQHRPVGRAPLDVQQQPVLQLLAHRDHPGAQDSRRLQEQQQK